MRWFNVGKRRTKFGEWLDSKGITQQKVSQESGVSKDTITRLANDKEHRPSLRTRRRLDRALKGEGFRPNDFWGPPL